MDRDVPFVRRKEFTLSTNQHIGVSDLLPAVAIERQEIVVDRIELLPSLKIRVELVPFVAGLRLVAQPTRRPSDARRLLDRG